MSDWQVGDDAMIVREGAIKCPNPSPRYGSHLGTQAPPKGAVRKVVAVESVPWDWANLPPCGCVRLCFSDGQIAHTARCIKITPPSADQFDLEVIELMNGSPVKETAI